MAKTISPLKLSFKSAVWTQNKSNHSRSGHPWRPGFDGRVYLPILDRALKAGAMVSHCERWRNMPCVTTFSGRWDEPLPEISSSIHPFLICSKKKLQQKTAATLQITYLPEGSRRPIPSLGHVDLNFSAGFGVHGCLQSESPTYRGGINALPPRAKWPRKTLAP